MVAPGTGVGDQGSGSGRRGSAQQSGCTRGSGLSCCWLDRTQPPSRPCSVAAPIPTPLTPTPPPGVTISPYEPVPGFRPGRGEWTRHVGHARRRPVSDRELHRFPNTPVRVFDALYWDSPGCGTRSSGGWPSRDGNGSCGSTVSVWTPGAWISRCWVRTARWRIIRAITAIRARWRDGAVLPAGAARRGFWRRPASNSCSSIRCTSCTHAQLAGSPPWRPRGTCFHAGPAQLLADGRGAIGSDHRQHNAVLRSCAMTWAAICSSAWGCRRTSCPIVAGNAAGQHDGSAARARLCEGGHDTASAVAAVPAEGGTGATSARARGR